MLPLRFKAVNKFTNKTGPGLVFSVLNNIPFDKQHHEYYVCQSTGLTDIHKNELFFNDAVSYCDVIYYLEWSEGQIMLVPMEKHQHSEYALDLVESGVMSGRVIGNRWEPIEELKKRVLAFTQN